MDLSSWLDAVPAFDALIVVVGAFLVGGLVKGLIGGGLPTTVVPIMAMVIDPALAAATTLVPVAVTNLWQAIDGNRLMAVLRRFWAYYLALAIGVAAGSQILTGLPPRTAGLVIGVAVIVLSPIPLATHRFRISPEREPLLNPLVGGVLGVLAGATVVVTPTLVYFAALRLDKDFFVTTIGVSAICCMVPLYIGLGYSADLDWAAVRFSVLLLVPTMAGYLAGRALRNAISQQTFRLILVASLVFVGIGLVYKGLVN